MASWTFWKADLSAPGTLNRDITDPGNGFWRQRSAKTKPDYPIAIWEKDGIWHVKVGEKLTKGGEDILLEFLSGATWLNATAVSHEDYTAALSTGFWPGDNKHARKMDDAERMGVDLTTGDNAAPLEETLADQIAALSEKIDNTIEPTTQLAANKLAADLDKLRLLLKKAEDERVKEKEPFLQGGREVDAKWQAIGGPGAASYRGGEEKRKAYLRKVQAEIDKQVADQKAAQKAAEGDSADQATTLPGEVVPATEAPKAQTSGGVSRASGLSRVKVLEKFDPKVMADHFINTDDMDFLAYLEKRAKASIRAKSPLPGVTEKEELK